MSNRHEHSAVESGALDTIKEMRDQIQSDLETSQKSSDTKDPVDVALYGTFSMIFAHFFIRHKISANKVTMMSLILGVVGSLFFYPRNLAVNFVGVFIEYFAVVLDCSDGEVARMTHTGSQLGRFLDGLVDSVNFAAIYIVLGLRMMHEPIPFTSLIWSWSIWILIVISGLCHAEQARMADYFRSLHLHFIDENCTAWFTSSWRIKEELKESKGTPLYNRLYLAVYFVYTKAQEISTPHTQRLLRAIEESGGVSHELAWSYTAKSRKYIQLTNVLTFNLRAWVLFVFILIRLHPFFFPFNIIVLGGIMLFMVNRYEKIARDVYSEFFED